MAHSIVLVSMLCLQLFHSELFKSNKVMTAVLKEDLYIYKLVFREDGCVENRVSGMFGFSQIYNGKYKIQGDLIIFTTKPYDNGFIPDTMLLDRRKKIILKDKKQNGAFDTVKNYINHFEVRESKLD